MFNIELHPAFGALKKILISIKPRNFKEFIDVLQKEAKKKADSWKTDTDNYGFLKFEKKFIMNGIFNEQLYKDAISSKILGDAMEIFAAFFCQWFDTDIHFGVKRSSWIFTGGRNEDLGCDAVGELLSNSSKCFVQIKYRSSPKAVPFNLEVFSKLFTQATISYGLDYSNENQRLLFFTNIPVSIADKKNAQSLPFINLASQCKVPVLLIGRNEIEHYTGDTSHSNSEFWKNFNSMFTS